MSYPYIKKKLSDGTTKDEHRIIMEQIIGRKLTFNELVHHKDENKKNNMGSNLEIKSRSKHSKDHNTGKEYTKETINKLSLANRGTLNYSAKLSEDSIREIKLRLSKGEISSSIRLHFGISKSHMSRIKTGQNWSHIK